MKLSIVLLACVCSLSGCSVAGYLAGSEIDRRAPEFDTLKTYSSLDPGDEVTIFKNDGSSVTGTVAEPLQHLSFEQKVAKIAGTSTAGFDLNTGSFSIVSMPSQKALPTSIVLQQPGNEDEGIPMDYIQLIVVPHEKNAAFTGLVLGAATDVALAVIISNIKILQGPLIGSW